jgi:hypothetical protein
MAEATKAQTLDELARAKRLISTLQFHVRQKGALTERSTIELSRMMSEAIGAKSLLGEVVDHLQRAQVARDRAAWAKRDGDGKLLTHEAVKAQAAGMTVEQWREYQAECESVYGEGLVRS